MKMIEHMSNNCVHNSFLLFVGAGVKRVCILFFGFKLVPLFRPHVLLHSVDWHYQFISWRCGAPQWWFFEVGLVFVLKSRWIKYCCTTESTRGPPKKVSQQQLPPIRVLVEGGDRRKQVRTLCNVLRSNSFVRNRAIYLEYIDYTWRQICNISKIFYLAWLPRWSSSVVMHWRSTSRLQRGDVDLWCLYVHLSNWCERTKMEVLGPGEHFCVFVFSSLIAKKNQYCTGIVCQQPLCVVDALFPPFFIRKKIRLWMIRSTRSTTM